MGTEIGCYGTNLGIFPAACIYLPSQANFHLDFSTFYFWRRVCQALSDLRSHDSFPRGKTGLLPAHLPVAGESPKSRHVEMAHVLIGGGKGSGLTRGQVGILFPAAHSEIGDSSLTLGKVLKNLC